ncbi:hypothetical protein LY78DRAFT_346020 [Colletotrichum sublineola]|nr:hypothetical protein LY78DRAFT_346020 [Colletotrichum sublineola]
MDQRKTFNACSPWFGDTIKFEQRGPRSVCTRRFGERVRDLRKVAMKSEILDCQSDKPLKWKIGYIVYNKSRDEQMAPAVARAASSKGQNCARQNPHLTLIQKLKIHISFSNTAIGILRFCVSLIKAAPTRNALSRPRNSCTTCALSPTAAQQTPNPSTRRAWQRGC